MATLWAEQTSELSKWLWNERSRKRMEYMIAWGAPHQKLERVWESEKIARHGIESPNEQTNVIKRPNGERGMKTKEKKTSKKKKKNVPSGQWTLDRQAAAFSFVVFVDRVSDPTVAIAAARSKKKNFFGFFWRSAAIKGNKKMYIWFLQALALP